MDAAPLSRVPDCRAVAGLTAAVTALVRHTLRALVTDPGWSPGAILRRLNDLLVPGAPNRGRRWQYVRPRPELDDPITHAFGKSFPSGHTMASTVGYGSLLLAWMPLIPVKWRKPLIGAYFVLVAAVGASRLGLGVHFFSDVVGGFVLGLAWLAARGVPLG